MSDPLTETRALLERYEAGRQAMLERVARNAAVAASTYERIPSPANQERAEYAARVVAERTVAPPPDEIRLLAALADQLEAATAPDDDPGRPLADHERSRCTAGHVRQICEEADALEAERDSLADQLEATRRATEARQEDAGIVTDFLLRITPRTPESLADALESVERLEAIRTAIVEHRAAVLRPDVEMSMPVIMACHHLWQRTGVEPR